MRDKPLFDEADIIFTYTRAQAIADGILDDLSDEARQAGLLYPTAITTAAWSATIEPPPDCPEQSASGRMWDVFCVLRSAVKRNGDSDRVDFKVRVRRNAAHYEDVPLKALVHPGDEGEPVITIMLPNED